MAPSAHSGSRWEKSVAQSDTCPVITSLYRLSEGSGRRSWLSWANRSSTDISVLLEKVDRGFRAVVRGEAGVVLASPGHPALPGQPGQGRVALLVPPQQVRHEGVAAAVPLAPPRIDLDAGALGAVCGVGGGPRGGGRRASSARPASWRRALSSGPPSAGPAPSEREKCATADAAGPGSSAPRTWASGPRRASHSARSWT